MDRRAFISGVTVGLFAAPLAAGAPARRVWRIAWLAEDRDPGRESQAPGGGRWFFDALRVCGRSTRRATRRGSSTATLS